MALYAQAKTGIENVYPKAVETLMDSIQKYESPSSCKSIHHMWNAEDFLTLYEKGGDHHPSPYDAEYGSRSNDQEIEHDTLLGLTLHSCHHYPQNRDGIQNF